MLTMATIAGRGAALLHALHNSGEWMTRADLAAATGKRSLSPNDRNWLERFEREGLIEVDTRPVVGPAQHEYLYRARVSEPILSMVIDILTENGTWMDYADVAREQSAYTNSAIDDALDLLADAGYIEAKDGLFKAK